MIHHHMLPDHNVLVIVPTWPLTADDFGQLQTAVEPLLAERTVLDGLIIEAGNFPKWQNLQALLAHLRFVRTHHRRVKKVAIIANSLLLQLAPLLAEHFVAADIECFDNDERDAAYLWATT